jgi:signal transduction histidine kinase
VEGWEQTSRFVVGRISVSVDSKLMNPLRWLAFERFRELLEETSPPPEQMAQRLRSVERDIILPVKAVFILILIYNLFFSSWFDDIALPQTVAQQTFERFFFIYLIFNLVVAGILNFPRRISVTTVQRTIFTSNFLDGLFVAALTFVTGGFDSILYWMFLGLIVRNALSCPLAIPQLILNFSASICYFAAGLFDMMISDSAQSLNGTDEHLTVESAEPFLLRLFLLWLLSVCCYGVQVLLEKQRRAADEAQEFAVRQQQLRAAGRLAAKIAHQIKNPLGIINNAAYSLQRALQESKPINPQQIDIIREEVERADQTITRLMGYSQLAEGRVERLDVAEQIDRALAHAVPPAAKYPVTVKKDCAPGLPVLMMQRGHLSEILVNLLQNAREAVVGKGRIQITAALANHSVVITVSDDGPGIAKAKLDKIFQPYFTTKEKGTGLGLSIVKHNAELYGGTVQVESELGKGTRFTLLLPTRTINKPPE